MVFDDYYPGDHKSGLTIIQKGTRIAANGDMRLREKVVEISLQF
jgi:endoglucanase